MRRKSIYDTIKNQTWRKALMKEMKDKKSIKHIFPPREGKKKPFLISYYFKCKWVKLHNSKKLTES